MRDKLATDVGDGWLIFDTTEANICMHPTDGNEHASGPADISFYCDDINETVGTLRERGVEFTQEFEDHGYVILFNERGGLVTYFKVPGGFAVQLHEPKYPK